MKSVKFNYKNFVIKRFFLYLTIVIFVLMIGHTINTFSYANIDPLYKNIIYNENYNYPVFDDTLYDSEIAKYIDNINKDINSLNYKINYVNDYLNILFIKEINGQTLYDSILFSPDKKVISLNEYVNNDEYSVIYHIKEELVKNNINIENEIDISNISILIGYDNVELYINDNDKIYPIIIDNNTFKEVVSKPIEPSNYKYIAFTFDDGPSKYTLEIMDILDKYDFKATFFEVGYMMRSNQNIVKEVVNRGYEVGNHTVDHSNLNKLNESNILQKINNNNDLFKSYTGSEMKLVRCPYGNSNKKVRGTINNPIIYWSVDSRDWESRNTDKIYNLVINNTKEGDIILFHDIYGTTRDAIEKLANYFYKNGYKVVSVSELFQMYNKNLENHVVYYNAR